MTTKRAIVIGLGKRVREATLPAFERCTDLWDVTEVYAKNARVETVAGRTRSVKPLGELDGAALDGVDLIYLAVGKDVVPRVLDHLVALQVARIDLLIDTPVVRFKHFRHAKKLEAFRNTWVPEDCAVLPWFDTVSLAAREGLTGSPHTVHFHRAAYAYHAFASAKALLSAGRVRRGVRRASPTLGPLREVDFARTGPSPFGSVDPSPPDAAATMISVEPRNYAEGWIRIEGPQGSITDAPDENPGATHLESQVANGHVTGFRLGDLITELDDAESALTEGALPGQRVIALQEPMKRVGLLRILRGVHAGQGAYPLLDGLDDMVVDYHLEKFGRYLANPFTSARSPLARGLLSGISRVAGR